MPNTLLTPDQLRHLDRLTAMAERRQRYAGHVGGFWLQALDRAIVSELRLCWKMGIRDRADEKLEALR